VEELAAALNLASDRLATTAAERQRLRTELTCRETQLEEAAAQLQQLR
jgi:hypothetical protein